MFRSLKRALVTICIVAVFAVGFLLGRGEGIERECFSPAFQQAVMDMVDIQRAKEYLLQFAPGLREGAQEMLRTVFSSFLEKILC